MCRYVGIEEKQNTVKPHPEDRRGSPLQGALDSDISLDGYDQHLEAGRRYLGCGVPASAVIV